MDSRRASGCAAFGGVHAQCRVHARRRVGAAFAFFVALLAAAHASAGETPLVAAGVFYESSAPTLAPLLALRFPVGEGRVLTLSQLGWTSGASFELPQTPRWTLLAGIGVTPLRAHQAHDIYDSQGHPLKGAAFDATALRATAGEAYEVDALTLVVRAVFLEEWLSRLPRAELEAFRSPFVGAEATARWEWVRSEDPLRSRIDGVRVTLRGEGLYGARSFGDGDIVLSLGRKLGRAFLHVNASAFFVGLDHPATRQVIGGSWDLLGASALVGHPLGAFRVTRGAAGTLGLDSSLVGPLELGVRASLLAGASSVHHGLALLTETELSGIHLFAGAGTPDGALFRGDAQRTVVFGGANGALFFLP
jgi:hypothetical protein